MAQDDLNKEIMPDPDTLQLSVDVDVVNATAIRRGKVRELMRMGYSAPTIQKILQKGIKMADGNILDVDVSVDTIKDDITYVRQEMAASGSEDVMEKRAEILDKLSFLYERAMTDYGGAKGQTRNSFLNTALNIMGKIVEIEGVKAPDKLDANLASARKMSNLADQINKLGDDERKRIVTTIRAVLEQRRGKGDGRSDIPDRTPRVRDTSSVDEGVSGES